MARNSRLLYSMRTDRVYAYKDNYRDWPATSANTVVGNIYHVTVLTENERGIASTLVDNWTTVILAKVVLNNYIESTFLTLESHHQSSLNFFFAIRDLSIAFRGNLHLDVTLASFPVFIVAFTLV